MNKTLDQWFDEYAVSHQNPTNIRYHKICVPLIFWSVVAMLNSTWMGGLNLALIAEIAALVFYFRLDQKAGFLMIAYIVVAEILCAIVAKLTGGRLLEVAVLVFVGAWIGQFKGHQIEGKKPSFTQDLQFLLIGPLWLLKPYLRP